MNEWLFTNRATLAQAWFSFVLTIVTWFRWNTYFCKPKRTHLDAVFSCDSGVIEKHYCNWKVLWYARQELWACMSLKIKTRCERVNTFLWETRWVLLRLRDKRNRFHIGGREGRIKNYLLILSLLISPLLFPQFQGNLSLFRSLFSIFTLPPAHSSTPASSSPGASSFPPHLASGQFWLLPHLGTSTPTFPQNTCRYNLSSKKN